MHFSNIRFAGNVLSYTDEKGQPQEEDFFLMIVRWALAKHNVDFTRELATIRVEPPEEGGPVTMTFKEALGHLPPESRQSAIMKALDLLVPEGTYKVLPRKAPAVLRKIGKVKKIKQDPHKPVSIFLETILNQALA